MGGGALRSADIQSIPPTGIFLRLERPRNLQAVLSYGFRVIDSTERDS
jgi:hypothetical protein